MPLEKQERVESVIFDVESSEGDEDQTVPTLPTKVLRKDDDEVTQMVDALLKERLGDAAFLVVRYLDRPVSQRNTMPIPNTVKASLRYDISSTATAAIASGFLKDLIVAGHLGPDLSYLSCDPSKLMRARKGVLVQAREEDQKSQRETKIVGIGYDG